MLVLTRKLNQRTTIIDRATGRTIGVRVLSINGDSMRIGFEDDPRHFDVLRDEAVDKKGVKS